MDPFEVRMQFLALLRRLNASQQSIQKVVGFAVKYFRPCGEDLWDCIVEECQKGSINARINILYFLDSLCETCLLVKSHPQPSKTSTASSTVPGPSDSAVESSANSDLYVAYVARDLAKIVEHVVPPGRQGLPNLISTKQILESWRSKRVIDPQKVDQVISSLNNRDSGTSAAVTDSTNPPLADSTDQTTHHLPRHEIFKRIEEDRERHKRLRERRWVQPVSHSSLAAHPIFSGGDLRPLHSHGHGQSQHLVTAYPPLACFLPLTDSHDGERELTLDIEFENEWDATSDWNEDDDEAAAEESELCFPTPLPKYGT